MIIEKHDPDKVIKNISSHTLSEAENNLLCKGLNYGLPQQKLNYADYVVNFECLYRDIRSLDIDNDTKALSKLG